MSIGLERRYKNEIPNTHPILPWVVGHAATVLNIAHVGKDGRTAYERRKGKRFKKQIPEIGECIWYIKPESIGEKGDQESRWRE